jgi:hypothetical protein
MDPNANTELCPKQDKESRTIAAQVSLDFQTPWAFFTTTDFYFQRPVKRADLGSKDVTSTGRSVAYANGLG